MSRKGMDGSKVGWGLLSLLFLFNLVFAGTRIPPEKYKSSTLSPEITNNADAVIRFEKRIFSVSNSERARENVHLVVTVLNAEGRDFGQLVLPYDKFLKIKNLDGNLFDSEGEEIRSLSNNDIKDYLATSDYSLYDDNRVKIATLVHSVYPYTIEYEYEIVFDGYINWPSWYPEREKAYVEESHFEVELPEEDNLRYWKNIENEPKIEQKGDIKKYVWDVQSLQPFESEPLGPPVRDQLRCVRLAPEKFKIEKHAGDFSSWKNFGEWFYRLQTDRQELPTSLREEILNVTDVVSNPIEKIKAVYHMLQTKTRYVSIQLGIGGWQTFDAKYVYEHGYGDCKALTNYMLSMLKAINIPSYHVLISNNSPAHKFLPEFPSNQFNHVVLFVPTPQETLWLECTSNTMPFGHLGKWGENKYALLITEQGGTLVKTPRSNSKDNSQIRSARVRLLPFGDAVATVLTTYSGNQQDYVRDGLSDAIPKDRENWLRENINIPAFEILQTDFSQVDKQSSPTSFSFQIQSRKYATVAGSRLLFHPNLMEQRSYVPKPLEKRTQPIVFSYPYFDVDSIRYSLPEGFTVEAFPKPVDIETQFATYRSSVSNDNDTALTYLRKFELKVTEISPDLYEEYRTFIQQIVQADKANVSLKKK